MTDPWELAQDRGEWAWWSYEEDEVNGERYDLGYWWWHRDLDKGSDCETCGWSPAEVEIDTENFVQFEVRIRVGCYGGDSFTGDLNEVVARLRDEWGHLAYTKDVTKALRASVRQAKEMA